MLLLGRGLSNVSIAVNVLYQFPNVLTVKMTYTSCDVEVEYERLLAELAQSASTLDISDLFFPLVLLQRPFNWIYFVDPFDYWV